MTTKLGFDAGLRRVKPAFPVIPGKPAAKKWAPEGARRERDKDSQSVAGTGASLGAFAVRGEVETFTLFFFRHTQTDHDIDQFVGDD
jgi:hypothetical protein